MTTENIAPAPAQAPATGLVAAEPALVYGGGATGASLVIDAIVGLGIPLDNTAKIIIILVVSVVGPLIGTWLTRQKVISPATMATIKAKAESVVETAEGLKRPEVVQPPVEAVKPVPPIV